MFRSQRSAITFACGLQVFLVTSASPLAADLGGACCADLEERIAVLEATTARNGQRKLSLEVYGHVNESLIWWDDGYESNVYQVTNDNARTRFGFRGKAKISSDWEAGYRIEIGIRTASSKRFTQSNDEGNDNPADVGLDLRDSFWYLKSKTYGAGSVGTQASATDGITEINLTQTRDFSKYSDVEDTGLGLRLRSSLNGGLSARSYRNLIGDSGDQPGDGDRRFNAVKYETPEIYGFALSTSWGEDDYWDIALRYAGSFRGFKVAAGIGYFELTDGPETKLECAARGRGIPNDENCRQMGGSISVVHEETGLFLNLGAGFAKDEVLSTVPLFSGTRPDNEESFWSVQAGIERKFNTLGKTTIYGEYYDYEGGAINRTVSETDAVNVFAPGSAAAFWDTGLQVYGLGFAQGIDKAATVLYLSYRHVEGELTLRQIVGGVASGAIAQSPIEDLDLVQAGAIVKF